MDWSLKDRWRHTFMIWLSMASFLVLSQTNATATTAASNVTISYAVTTSTSAFPPTSKITGSSITPDISNACHNVPGCLPIHNNRSCITVTQNVGNANWFTSASSCEASGGRLVWLHDTNISEFTTVQLQTIKHSSCPSCTFFWIGLVQSLDEDGIYFWKRPQNETIGQCKDAVSCANCSDYANKTECELLGCCFNRGTCRYQGNLTEDFQNQYEFHGLHLQNSSNYRHCVGLQEGLNNKWKLRTVQCTGRNLPQNGYICEYKCGVDWPVPAPMQNISLPTRTDTDCNGTSPWPSTRQTSPVTSSSLLFLTASSNHTRTTRPLPLPTQSTVNHAAATTSRVYGSSTNTSGKKSSLWTVPFIALLSICSGLLVICLVCIIVICKLKKSLGRRSKLYPGAVPEDDEHTYMDLGDHPMRPPPVELKSVTGTSDSETKLTEANEKPKGIKSFKDRKRKPAPPLPQSAVPNKPPVKNEENDQSVIKEDKSKAKETKRQNSSVKKKPPNYNNTVPLDLSYDDEIDLYESYEHKEATDSSYTNSMIEEALTDTDENTMVNEDGFKKEMQNPLNFERENSNRLRNAQGSFIVSDDAHHEGLVFTERQISNSGLPEIVVEYNANKEAESPLHLQEMQAYENQAFETIDEDATHTEDEKLTQTSVDVDDTEEVPIINKERIEEDVHQIGNSEPDIPLYDDDNIPTKISENTDIDALPLYKDANETSISDAPFYDDNFVPESITAEKDTVDILHIYDCANDNNESQEMADNTAISLPLYELAVETNVVEHCDNDSTVEQTEPTDIDELGLYEDYEISKLPPAPPPPIRQDLNDTLRSIDTTQGEILTLKPNKVTLDNVHIQMPIGGAENTLPPEPPKRIGVYQLQNDSNRNILKEPSNSRDRNNVWDNGSTLDFSDSAPDTNPVVNDKILTPNINSEQWKNDTNAVFQNSQSKTPKLLDLSLEPERKFRSGSKVDVFDEPVISQSDDYFLDMNDAPSEIFDASPVIGDGKLISVNTVSNELTEANHLPAPAVFDNSSFGINSDSSYGNIVTEASLRKENDKSITNVTTDAAINADSVAIGSLLDFGTEQSAPISEQAGLSHQPIQQNRNFDPLSDLVQIGNPGDDSDIYDIPPPNFPPPELRLN